MGNNKLWLVSMAVCYTVLPIHIVAQNNVVFESIRVPKDNTQKNGIQVTQKVTVNKQVQTIGFSTLLKTGYKDNGEIYGQLKDKNDHPITLEDSYNFV